MFSRGARMLIAIVLGCFMFVGLAVASPGHGKGDIKSNNSANHGSSGNVKKAKFGLVVGKTLLDIACETSTTTTSPAASTDTTTSMDTTTTMPTTSTTTSVEATNTPTTSIEASPTALAHVHLRLMTKKGKKLQATAYAAQSDRKGYFAFKNVKPGHYWLKLWAKDALPVDLAAIDVTVTAGNTVTIPDIHFTCKTKK